MIAVSIPRRRIAFMPGLTDTVKKKLVMDLWIARPFISENLPLPNMYDWENESKPENNKLEDKIYF